MQMAEVSSELIGCCYLFLQSDPAASSHLQRGQPCGACGGGVQPQPWAVRNKPKAVMHLNSWWWVWGGDVSKEKIGESLLFFVAE